ncbi:S26 family signal peptidase [Halovivax gelatinilyticus]|uniref:S26 family signal peptidase n=1 Tax=Halovivax gelatinilyticus TaxID=2961597 RepID=UPI0020CA3B95|nr:S26 family signal peptidase [Halovivax gelatinilyticus]
MTIKTGVTYAAGVIGAIVVISLVLGMLLGQPVLFAYVETGSMEPTLSAGDGYVAIPAPIASDVETGDVVAFEAESVHGGELTTHRVVDERERGYVTQGDANPFIDQSQGEPPLTDGQIHAVALQVNGEVVAVPHMGTVAMGIDSGFDRVESLVFGTLGGDRFGSGSMTYLLFGVGVLLLASSVVGGPNRERQGSRSGARTREDSVDSRVLLAGCLVLLCLAATVAMVVPAGGEHYGIVSTEGNSSNPTVVPVGESDDFDYEIHNGGFVPTVSYLSAETNGIDLEPERIRLARGESENVSVTVYADDETGYHVESSREYRYLVVLPPVVIDSLYSIHPWLPSLAIYATISTPVWLAWRRFSGPSDRIRTRSRPRSGPRFNWLHP